MDIAKSPRIYLVTLLMFISSQRVDGQSFSGPRPGVRQLQSISRVTTDADVERILEQDDTNKDGKLGEGDRTRPNLARNLARFDTNSDGFLDASEIKKTGLRPYGGAVFLEAFDKDEDGFLTKEEAIYGPLSARFENYDTNEDGKLSKEEMDSFRGGMLFGSGQRGEGFAQFVMDRLDKDGDARLSNDELTDARLFNENFDKLDTNEDGFLSTEEVSRFREVAFQGRRTGGRRDRFAEADRDGNGKLSKDEIPEPLSSIMDFESSDLDKDGMLTREEFMRGGQNAFATRTFNQVDKDGDGRITKDERAEAPPFFLSRFADADKDGNGLVTSDEWAEYMSSLSANRVSNPDEMLRRLFDKNDENKDGRITQNEATSRFWKRVSSFDTNQDGEISEEEFRLGEGKREHEANTRRTGQRLLGLRLAEAEKGLAITRVTPGSPAYDAKVQAGDILLSIRGEAVDSLDNVRQLVNEGPNSQVLRLIREQKEIELTVQFATSSEDK